MAFNNLPKGPQDYLNFYHTDKDGNIWLDGDGKPISLQQNLTGQTSKISPQELWESIETRQKTHQPHDPNLKKIVSSTVIDPNTVTPPEPPVSPIKDTGKTGQIEKELLTKILIAWIEEASIGDVNLLSGNLADMFQKLKEGRLGLPNQNSTNQKELEILKREKCMAEQEIFQLRTALKTETQNLTKTFDIKLKDCQDKLDTANRKNQVLNDQVKQLQTEQNTFMYLTGKTHKQEMDKLQTQHQTSITALNARITELQQQLQANQFQQFQLPPPFTTQNQTFNTTANDTLIQNLSTSLIMQTNIAKQQLLIQAKAYDGKDPKEISDWLDEVDRLSSQNGYTHLEVAIQTSRGSVHKYIKELQKQGLDWDNTKFRLRERYSDCNSSAAAKSKLATLKQNGRPMHSYISNFTDLLEHAHGIKPSNPGTYLLATNFIDGIDESNRYIRNKLRERTWTNLELCFAEAQTLQYKQEIRAIDFKPDTETETNTIDINAIRGNSQTCHKCNSPNHFIKDCPHNRHQSNYRDRDNYKPKTQQDNQIDRLIEALASFTKTVSNNGQNYNRQGNSQPNNRHANFQSKSSNNYPRPANKQYNSYKGNILKQSVQANAIDDCNPSDNESDHCEDEGMGPHSENSDTESKN